MNKDKLYKTAYALVGCAAFKAGECVAVSYDWTAPNGVVWFKVKGSKGETVYPKHHLTDFVW